MGEEETLKGAGLKRGAIIAASDGQGSFSLRERGGGGRGCNWEKAYRHKL